MCLLGAASSIGLIVIILGLTQRPDLGLYTVIFGSDLRLNVLAITFLLFFLPMLCLGTISPQVIRLSIKDTAHAGRTAGTRLRLVHRGGDRRDVRRRLPTHRPARDEPGRLPARHGPHGHGRRPSAGIGQTRPSCSSAASSAGSHWSALFVLPYLIGRGFTAESKYYAINVSAVYDQDDPDERIVYKTLALDHLLHSSVNLNNPYWLYYPHEYIQGEFVLSADVRASRDRPAQVLIIGGGGYTFPRFVEGLLPAGRGGRGRDRPGRDRGRPQAPRAVAGRRTSGRTTWTAGSSSARRPGRSTTRW